MLNLLRRLRHGPLRRLGPLWVRLGNGYRRLISSLGLSVAQNIGPYGPFRLDARFAFSDFEHWGGAHNDGFVDCVEACRGRHCVFDIGAHIGLVSLPVASVLADDGLLVSFEPAVANRRLLERHLSLNTCNDRVRVEPFLVGAENRGDVLLHESDEASGMNSLAAREGDYRQVQHVQVSLDDYCRRHSLTPEVIKIDVEGAELGVLEGAREILDRYRPDIFLSVHPWHIAQLGRSTDELAVLIDELEYDCHDGDGRMVTEFALREYRLVPRQGSQPESLSRIADEYQ